MVGEGQVSYVRGDIKAANKAIQDAADGVRAIKVAAPVRDIATALPGSKSAAKANTLAPMLEADKQAWVRAAHNYKSATVAVIGSLDNQDVYTQTEIRRLGIDIDTLHTGKVTSGIEEGPGHKGIPDA